MPGPVFLSGDRIELRTIERDDLDFMQAAVNDSSIWRAIGTATPVNGLQEEAFFENVVSEDDQVNLLVTVDGEATGMVSLTPDETETHAAELGYWMDADYREQGYCSEAVAVLTDYGFQQRALNRVSARVFAFNDASQALLESVGFVREGTQRQAVFVDGEYHDVYWYSILTDEWE